MINLLHDILTLEIWLPCFFTLFDLGVVGTILSTSFFSPKNICKMSHFPWHRVDMFPNYEICSKYLCIELSLSNQTSCRHPYKSITRSLRHSDMLMHSRHWSPQYRFQSYCLSIFQEENLGGNIDYIRHEKLFYWGTIKVKCNLPSKLASFLANKGNISHLLCRHWPSSHRWDARWMYQPFSLTKL